MIGGGRGETLPSAWNRVWINCWCRKRNRRWDGTYVVFWKSYRWHKFLQPLWDPAVSPWVSSDTALPYGLTEGPSTPSHQLSVQIAFYELWNKEMLLLMTLTLLHFFSTYFCFLLFLLNCFHWYSPRTLFWKSSQQIDMMTRTETWQEVNPCSSTGKSLCFFFISGRIQMH